MQRERKDTKTSIFFLERQQNQKRGKEKCMEYGKDPFQGDSDVFAHVLKPEGGFQC